MKGCIVKATQNTPDWAVSLVEQVCKGYNRAKPADLVWHNSKHVKSGGVTYYAKTKSGKQMLKDSSIGWYRRNRPKARSITRTCSLDRRQRKSYWTYSQILETSVRTLREIWHRPRICPLTREELS